MHPRAQIPGGAVAWAARFRQHPRSNPRRLPLPRAGRHRRGLTVRRPAGGGRDYRIVAVKFLVDMPLPPALAHWLAAQGHDAVHASAMGLDRSTDREILTRSRQETRTVVTADLDYPRLLALTAAGRTKPDLVSRRSLERARCDGADTANSSVHGRERDNAQHCCRRSHPRCVDDT